MRKFKKKTLSSPAKTHVTFCIQEARDYINENTKNNHCHFNESSFMTEQRVVQNVLENNRTIYINKKICINKFLRDNSFFARLKKKIFIFFARFNFYFDHNQKII
jgi:hypothetical protein